MSGHIPSTTNNRAEVLALINGLMVLKKPCEVEWVTDSNYAIGVLKCACFASKVKSKKPNRDLIMELRELVRNKKHDVNPIWIRGHNGHPENERCDQLAGEARTSLKTQRETEQCHL